MKPRLFTAILLFISAYSPLFIILAIKDFDFEKAFRFKHPIADYSIIGLSILSIILLFILIGNIQRGSMAVTIKAVRSRSLDIINYTIPYLFCAFDIDISKIEDIITIGLFLVLLLVLTINTQSIFINPILAIRGYTFYDVDYEFDKKTYSTVVISKIELNSNNIYYIRSFTRFLYFVTQEKTNTNEVA